MPPPSELHLAQYPSANPQPPPVPFVTRLNHEPRLLQTLQGRRAPSVVDRTSQSSPAPAETDIPAELFAEPIAEEANAR